MKWLADINWSAAGVIITVLGVGWIILAGMLRQSLQGVFLTKDNFQEVFAAAHAAASAPLASRVAEIEQQLEHAPTAAAVNEIDRRVGDVEDDLRDVKKDVVEVRVGVGRLQSGQDAQNTALANITRQLGTITRHLLGEKS